LDDLVTSLKLGLYKLRVDLDTTQIRRLIFFLKLIAKWNRVYNLTAVREPESMVSVHLLDSLSVLSYIKGSRIADVGSGAGLPGIPLAVCQPEKQFVLLDSQARKTRFIQQAVMELKLLNVQVRRARVESFSETKRFDTVVCRAFSSLSGFISVAGGLCKRSGCMLALKGKYPSSELTDIPAGYEIKTVKRLEVPGLDRQRHVVEIVKV
jgi:16S rRNA (guanine527-N7)-methyltransferase